MSPPDDSFYQQGAPLEPTQVPDDVIVSPDTRRSYRIPPGQSRTRKWPVLDAFGTPQVDPSAWRLTIFGAVERPGSWDLAAFAELPRVRVLADFHCVTRWSRLGNLWEGVSTRELLDRCKPLPEARFVILHAADHGWSTNLPLADFLADDALIADLHDGQPLEPDHGGPVRAIVPRLYAWKSAKWLTGIELSSTDRPGFWERGGYHDRGDPWREERFR